MSKVILVPESEPCLEDIEVYKFIHIEPEDIEIHPGIKPSELVKIISLGDEVVCHRFLRNAEGVAVGEQYASIVCQSGAEKLLTSALYVASETDSIWDIVSNLAQKLRDLHIS